MRGKRERWPTDRSRQTCRINLKMSDRCEKKTAAAFQLNALARGEEAQREEKMKMKMKVKMMKMTMKK